MVDLYGQRTGHKADADALSVVFSAGKSVSAILIAIMVDKGHLKYEEKVSTYWPEFGKNGKENITVAQCMAHESGLVRTPGFDLKDCTPEGLKKNIVGEKYENDVLHYCLKEK